MRGSSVRLRLLERVEGFDVAAVGEQQLAICSCTSAASGEIADMTGVKNASADSQRRGEAASGRQD